MLDESHYHSFADATLQHIYDQLEQAFDEEELDDLDYDEGSGILTIVTPSEQTFIVSKHGTNRQLWLASPISGGLHFDFSSDAQEWILPDGTRLKSVLSQNLNQSAKLNVIF